MVEIAVLASHSSGNCFFVKANGSNFLIDAGISCKQIVERLAKIGKTPEDINAILLTHEHSDHTRGIDVFSKKYRTPVYATKGTYEGCRNRLKYELDIRLIEQDKTFLIDNVEINPFSKCHDCNEPVGYSISHAGKTVSIITDIGNACSNVRHAVRNSDMLCLESNHDLDMLNSGPYPYYLKQRISGENGHISNYDAALLVMEHASPRLKKIFLSHLSETNNTPKLALEAMSIVKERIDLKDIELIITSRDTPTGLF